MSLKPLTLALLFLAATTCLTAQMETSPRWVAGGSFGINVTKDPVVPYYFYTPNTPGGYTQLYDNGNSFRLQATYYAGYTLSPHWLVGVQGRHFVQTNTLNAYADSLLNQPVVLEFGNSSIGVGLFGRYTINPGNKLGVFVQPGVSLDLLSDKNTLDGEERTQRTGNTLGANIGLGATYELSPRWRATLGMGGLAYTSTSFKRLYGDRKPVQTFSTEFNLASIRLGMELKF